MNSYQFSSIDTYLKLIKNDVFTQLIDSGNWSNISALAQILPSAITSFFGFECRLGVKESHADFLICADATEAGRKILAGNNYSIEIPDFLMAHPVWSNIHNFCTAWDTDTSLLYDKVRDVWLEFDIEGQPANIPIPSCFFGPEPIYSTKSVNPSSFQWVTQTALKLLLNRCLPSQVESQLFNCFDLLPPQAYVFQIGVMLARKSDLVRICIRNISPEQIIEYLTQINWPGSIRELKTLLAQLYPFVERIDLDLDVGEVILPKIGLECYLSRQPKLEPRWLLLLNYLVEAGLCIPEKREALLAYPGYIREKSNRESWPTHLLKLSNFLGPQYERVFFRGLHHIKVVYQPDKPLEAKAYLSVSHTLLTPQFLRQFRELQENVSV